MGHPVSIKGVLLLDGHVVLVKNPRNEWELPGGRADPGETHAQTLVREFAEELSVVVAVSDPIDAYLFEVIPGRHIHIVTYGCTLAGAFAPQVSEEHTEHRLWPVNRLSEINLPVGYRRSVEKWYHMFVGSKAAWHDITDGPLRRTLLRQACREDVAAMHQVRLAVKENRLTSTVITEADYVSAIEQHGRGWVVEERGEVVGFAVGDARDGNIWALFVHPGHEGRGHGRRLHDAMVSWLWSRGLDRLWLATEANTRARKFYQAAGWLHAGRTTEGMLRLELRSPNARRKQRGSVHGP